MIGLSLVLCMVFTLILFGIVFTTEDQIFVNQLSAEQKAYEAHQVQFPDTSWVSSNLRFQLVKSLDSLPTALSQNDLDRIAGAIGIHEYYDSQAAYFIDHFQDSGTGASRFLIFDVSDLLAVRGNKLPIFITIIILTLIVTIVAVLIAHRLVNRTLAPVRKLSHELQHGEFDDVVIELANEFSEDEIGILTRELATALGRVRDSAQREFEFNRGVSHELRSPIQVAQSATELLELRFDKEDSQISEYVGRLKRSMIEMNEIAEAFLWLASDRNAEPNDVYSVAALSDTVATIQAMYPSLKIIIDSSLAPDFTFPLPEKVGAVIVRNLLRNAISHGKNKPIKLTLTEGCITVENHASNDPENKQGFGVGLAIVKRICERFECEFSTQQDEDGTHQASINFKSSL
jgi:signal transduction histidine kinase